MPDEVCNALCTMYDMLQNDISGVYSKPFTYAGLELRVWCDFLHKRRNDAIYDWGGVRSVIVPFIQEDYTWYDKLDLVEFTIKWMRNEAGNNLYFIRIVDGFVNGVNRYFKQLSYSYHVINDEIVEITSEMEVAAIEDAIDSSSSVARNHLSNALSLLSKKPVGDYRNSIKESISAVESLVRHITGETKLGDALAKLENKGLEIPKVLHDAFVKLYAYTNQPSTGIRHALMEEDSKYIPDREEATFMLITCSAFISYIQAKMK